MILILNNEKMYFFLMDSTKWGNENDIKDKQCEKALIPIDLTEYSFSK